MHYRRSIQQHGFIDEFDAISDLFFKAPEITLETPQISFYNPEPGQLQYKAARFIVSTQIPLIFKIAGNMGGCFDSTLMGRNYAVYPAAPGVKQSLLVWLQYRQPGMFVQRQTVQIEVSPLICEDDLQANANSCFRQVFTINLYAGPSNKPVCIN